MKTFKLYSLLLIFIVTSMSSCDFDDSEKIIPPHPDEELGLNFWKDHRFETMTIITGSVSVLAVIDIFEKQRYSGETKVPSVYAITQTIVTDFDSDGFPDIMILLTDRDMNSPIMKAFTNKNRGRLLEIPVPNLPQHVYDNYQGGDILTATESSINHSVNYIANGTPTTGVFNYHWNAEKKALELTERR